MPIDVDQYYRTYGPMVMRRCRAILKDEEAAADAMQDVFVQLLRYQDRVDGRAPSSFLYTIATNTCLNRIRSAGRDRSHAVGEMLNDIARSEDHADRVLTGHFLERVFAEQKSTTQAMAVAYYLDGLTLEETARQFGMSVSGVRKRLRTLRAACVERAAA
jgi:RNA polymerase sigma-70 factor (ECF subfamily)